MQFNTCFLTLDQNGKVTRHFTCTCSFYASIFFVTNRKNNSRRIPVYLLEKSQVPLDIQTAFEDGEFSFTESSGTFNGIWSGMVTEKTVIKKAKGDGGIVGLTRKKTALIRWTLMRHIAVQYSAAMKERSGITSADNGVHQQGKAASMKQDKDHVRELISLFKNI